jgi:hypothetical protein
MIESCARLERVHLLFDGQLTAAEAEVERSHIAGCAACEAELHDVMQLESLAEELRESEAVSAPAVVDLTSHRILKKSRAGRWMGAATGLLAAALAFFAVRSGEERDPFGLGETRPIEARLSHAGASEYRRYDVARSGELHGVNVPLDTLARMEKRGDLQGVATGYLLRGEKSQASEALARAAQTPAIESDAAAAALASGDAEVALTKLDEALRTQPDLPQALWNRGLALRDLGLGLAAAEAFDQVAARKEPGWSEEAKERATALRADQAAQVAEWTAADTAGRELMDKLALPAEAMVKRHPGLFRLYFYDAVRTASDAAGVNSLRPLAAQLDELSGGQPLSLLLAHVAQADFAVRAPLAADYRKLVARTLDATATAALVERSEHSAQPDLRLGILFKTGIAAHLDEYARLAQESGDPWFAILATQERAAKLFKSDPLAAEQLLRGAIAQATAAHLDYRLSLAHLKLSYLFADVFQRAPEALVEARLGLSTARASGYLMIEQTGLYEAATATRLRWQFAIARGYLREALLRFPEDCGAQSFVHETASNLALKEQRPAEARAEFEALGSCRHSSDQQTALVLAELLRSTDRKTDDARHLAEALAALRGEAGTTPGQRAMLDHIEGRALLDSAPEQGRALLQKTIAESEASAKGDLDAQAARAFSYVALELDAARSGRFDEALALLGKEERAPIGPCTLGVGADDQSSFTVLSGNGGAILGSYDAKQTVPLNRFQPTLTAAQLEAVRGCKEVSVLARPPLQGRTGILPPEIAWSYGGRLSEKAAPAARAKRMIVSDAEPPMSLGLPRLGGWSAGAMPAASGETVELRGPLATPSRVLAEMANATEIEVNAHGLVDLAFSDASLIALSPDADGAWALSAVAVRNHPLSGRPLVLLGACRAAVGAPLLYAPWSLPAAFLEAGARAVLASRDDIPDSQVRPFFDAVLAGIRAGQSERLALRDARLAFRTKPGGAWVDSVLLFE